MKITAYKVIDDVIIVNATPHPIRFQKENGVIVEIPSDPNLVISAKAVEKKISDLYVETKFEKTPEGEHILDEIYEWYAGEAYEGKEKLVVVGSVLAAQAYKGEVAAMTPAKGFERVAPDLKRMNPHKFTIYR